MRCARKRAQAALPGIALLEGATAAAVLARGSDYCLALKGNQPALFKDVSLLLDDPEAPPCDVAATTDGDHGRIETPEPIPISIG